MSASNAQVAHLSVDLDDERNVNPTSHVDDGEFIETIVVPLRGLLKSIEDISSSRNASCDAKLYTFAMGLQFMQ